MNVYTMRNDYKHGEWDKKKCLWDEIYILFLPIN